MAEDHERGRDAAEPWHVPARGWREILKRVWTEVSRDNIDLVAAGVGFYWLLSVFPAMIAAVSIWGLVADPADVTRLVSTMGEAMPAEARGVLADQMMAVAGGPRAALGLGTVVGVLVALWGALKGTKALMAGLDIAYDETEKRGFFAYNGLAFLLLLAMVVAGIVATVGVIVLPAALGLVGLGNLEILLRVARWPLLGLGVLAFLAFAYRVGPSRTDPKWSWASPGAVAATLIWLAGSALFSLYVGWFGSYNETYGGIAGVVVLLLWFWLTAFAILVGAELNNELERQTAVDTTVGPPAPRGRRGAVAADEVAGEQPSHA
jgi:membrane protein